MGHHFNLSLNSKLTKTIFSQLQDVWTCYLANTIERLGLQPALSLWPSTRATSIMMAVPLLGSTATTSSQLSTDWTSSRGEEKSINHIDMSQPQVSHLYNILISQA